ncbi:MAG TPA: efflux RND transporter periplasmic adaptor subunit [Candidatus Binatia bacterium]|jgi:membrane fusion protein, copper/silver efflux system|nr:efflux RND transporter periplasmic adaptor subunit [Candidatus Binatia bacterium]
MKIVKFLGALVVLAGVFAVGYWRGQSEPRANRESSGHSESGTAGGTQSMQGHDMSSPGVNISPERQQLVGIRTATAEIRPLTQKIRTVGIVTYDETRVAQVFSKVEGWIEKLLVNYTGTLVRKGQPLFTLYSPDLVATQEEYLLALKAKQTLGSSSIKEISAGSDSLLESAHRRLSLWDISEEQINNLEKTGKPQRTLTFYSPISGFVLKKDAFQGMRVMPDKELYTITDLSTVWVNADIYEYELAHIHVGQKATINLAYYPARDFVGKVSWISPVLDEKTRTAKVRLEFANRDFILKPEMYANAEIEINAGRKLAVPDEAVLDSGLRKVVFLDKGEGRFEPAEVKIGNKFDGYYEVLEGLSPGERILASAGFLLDSESRLKEAMGAMAGMAGHDMKGAETQAAAKAGPQEKNVQDLTLTLLTQPEKPKAGENVIRLKISNKAGQPIKDAQVSFVFNMTMPGMVPSKGEGKLSKDGFYETKTMLAMAGQWEVTVIVRRPGQKEIQEKFIVVAS